MKLVERKHIDVKKWNDSISNSDVENVFMYTWYLDSVCSHWCALITEDYKTILPIPYTKKLGVRQMIQAPFTREYDVIGDEFNWSEVLTFLASDFKSIHFRNQNKGLVISEKVRTHQLLSLKEEFQRLYSTNAKRILKKTTEYLIETAKNPAVVLDLFRENVAHKVDTISKQDLVVLEKLMNAALDLKKGELLVVKENKEIVAAGFFLFDKQRVTYLKGASTDLAKKAGAMYYLMNRAMLRYQSDFTTFDFGGSDIDKVAEFYHKFGATDRTYYDYSIDDLPFWFKTLKKLKR
jgi:hypothetical protein